MDNLLILLPLYNDWEAAIRLLERIRQEKIRAEVLIVDDGSQESRPDDPAFHRDDYLTVIHILHLRRNLGHQRAIATGLVYTYQSLRASSILIMDSDGEDRPEDIRRLLSAATNNVVVFASRARRTESFLFRFFYLGYRTLHRLATGLPVRVGNFSVLPSSALESLVVSADLWNHYAATVFRTNLPRVEVPCVRGTRLQGKSKMNFISLVVHGLSALSVFSDVVSARFLAVVFVAILLCLIAIVLIGATYTSGLILIFLLQLVTLALGFCFLIISGRSHSLFLPIRDCPLFFGQVEQP
jgi:polyisoprenyl-phosphate glycosyltransferase